MLLGKAWGFRCREQGQSRCCEMTTRRQPSEWDVLRSGCRRIAGKWPLAEQYENRKDEVVPCRLLDGCGPNETGRRSCRLRYRWGTAALKREVNHSHLSAGGALAHVDASALEKPRLPVLRLVRLVGRKSLWVCVRRAARVAGIEPDAGARDLQSKEAPGQMW
jgi:hypothetical protein